MDSNYYFNVWDDQLNFHRVLHRQAVVLVQMVVQFFSINLRHLMYHREVFNIIDD